MRISHQWPVLLCGFLAATLTACRTVPTRGLAASAPRTTGPISRVAAIWSEAVLRQDSTAVAQGFAGKLYLFDESTAVVTAPGKFVIYAYDETASASNADAAAHIKPDFTWELSESDLQSLLKKDAIGWCYSVWLPCGLPVNVERRYSIMVSFIPEKASRVISESTLVTLPAIRGASNGAIAQARFQKPQELPVRKNGTADRLSQAP